MSSEIPEECKYVETCTRKVDVELFEHICCSSDWIHCEWIRPEDIQPFLKRPSEWKQEEESIE